MVARKSSATTEIDAELRRLGFNPLEIVVRGRVFIAVLAENVRLRGEISKLRRENLSASRKQEMAGIKMPLIKVFADKKKAR